MTKPTNSEAIPADGICHQHLIMGCTLNHAKYSEAKRTSSKMEQVYSTPVEVGDNLDTIRKRYARKVDSLNWQSISYQKEANKKFNEQLTSLINQIVSKELEDVQKEIMNLTWGGARGAEACSEIVAKHVEFYRGKSK